MKCYAMPSPKTMRSWSKRILLGSTAPVQTTAPCKFGPMKPFKYLPGQRTPPDLRCTRFPIARHSRMGEPGAQHYSIGSPHICPCAPSTDEPIWIKTVRTFGAESAHDLTVIRTRLSTPKDENALPLCALLILSDADTTRVCQGVYDALVTNEASPKAVSAVISLAAADILQRVSEDNQAQFIEVAHGLLFSAALQTIFQQVRDVEVLNFLYTAATAINALHKIVPVQDTAAATHKTVASGGGGLIRHLPVGNTVSRTQSW